MGCWLVGIERKKIKSIRNAMYLPLPEEGGASLVMRNRPKALSQDRRWSGIVSLGCVSGGYRESRRDVARHRSRDDHRVSPTSALAVATDMSQIYKRGTRAT